MKYPELTELVYDWLDQLFLDEVSLNFTLWKHAQKKSKSHYRKKQEIVNDYKINTYMPTSHSKEIDANHF